MHLGYPGIVGMKGPVFGGHRLQPGGRRRGCKSSPGHGAVVLACEPGYRCRTVSVSRVTASPGERVAAGFTEPSGFPWGEIHLTGRQSVVTTHGRPGKGSWRCAMSTGEYCGGIGRLAAHDGVLGCRHRGHCVGGDPTVPEGIHRWSIAGCPATASGPRGTPGPAAGRRRDRSPDVHRCPAGAHGHRSGGRARDHRCGNDRGPDLPVTVPRLLPVSSRRIAAARNRHRGTSALVLCSAIGDRG